MCSNWFWSGILSLSLRHLNEIRVLPYPAPVHFKPWSCQLGSTRQTNFVSPLNYNIIIQPKLITKHIDWHLFLAVLGKCMQAFYVYIWRGFLYWSLHLLLNDFSLGKSKWPSAVCLSKHDSHSRLSCSGGLKKNIFFSMKYISTRKVRQECGCRKPSLCICHGNSIYKKHSDGRNININYCLSSIIAACRRSQLQVAPYTAWQTHQFY